MGMSASRVEMAMVFSTLRGFEGVVVTCDQVVSAAGGG
jgi:hypothetical protein